MGILAGRSTRSLELMKDDRDYFQRQAESRIPLSAPTRAFLGIVVLVGGALLALLGITLLVADPSKMPSPVGAVILAAVLVTLGIGIGYIGIRLLSARASTSQLLSARGTRIASLWVVTLGMLMIIGSFFAQKLYFCVAGLFAFLVAYWLYRSSRSIPEEVA
jgi:hypothetical protein